jgi:hypothetical protein
MGGEGECVHGWGGRVCAWVGRESVCMGGEGECVHGWGGRVRAWGGRESVCMGRESACMGGESACMRVGGVHCLAEERCLYILTHAPAVHLHHETTQCFIKQARDFCILVSERCEVSG